MFYDSALTDNENAFRNITKTSEKVYKTHKKSTRKCTNKTVSPGADLKLE